MKSIGQLGWDRVNDQSHQAILVSQCWPTEEATCRIFTCSTSKAVFPSCFNIAMSHGLPVTVHTKVKRGWGCPCSLSWKRSWNDLIESELVSRGLSSEHLFILDYHKARHVLLQRMKGLEYWFNVSGNPYISRTLIPWGPSVISFWTFFQTWDNISSFTFLLCIYSKIPLTEQTCPYGSGEIETIACVTLYFIFCRYLRNSLVLLILPQHQ